MSYQAFQLCFAGTKSKLLIIWYQNGLVHAMDLLNHHRRYNLDEDKYNEIRSLIVEDSGSDLVKITENENQLKIVLMSRNDEEFNNIFNAYEALFDAIDNLTD